MTAPALPVRRPSAADAVALLAVFAGAVAVRTALAGAAGARSLPAGLLFAAVLAAAVAVSRPAPRPSARAVGLGVAAAGVLVLPVALAGASTVRGTGGYAGWAVATAFVATAEEAFLRGALMGALLRWRGSDVAVAGAAVAFALLHVPLYGWQAFPLDLAVGLGLGGLRLLTGGWAAPAVAHVTADLAGWWLV